MTAGELQEILEQCNDQFLLSPGSSVDLPDCFVRFHQAGWTLAAHRSLRVRPLESEAGTCIGWLLGEAFDAKGMPAAETVRLVEGRPLREQIENWIDAHLGRFAMVVLGAGVHRLYLDAAGSLAAVYDPSARRVGSTLTLLLADRLDHSYFDHDRARCEPNEYFPAGTTVEPNIERILPNHFLDLNGWHTYRHWPMDSIGPEPSDRVEQHVDRIAQELAAILRGALALRGEVYLPLTAGRDSRALAAIARAENLCDRVTFVTFDYGGSDPGARLDVEFSRALAQRFKLKHRLLPVLPSPDAQDRRRYLLRTGFSGAGGKRKDFYDACRWHLDLDLAWISGFGLEIARAVWWSQSLHRNTDGTKRSARSLPHMKLEPRTTQAIQQWQEWGATQHPCTEADLMYWENRVGAWASPHQYGTAPFALNLIASGSRRLLDASLRLPPDYRRSQRLCDDLARRYWPRLLEYPYASK